MARKKFKREVHRFGYRQRKGQWLSEGDKPVAVYGAAPGESAQVLVGKRRKGVHEGYLLDVQEASSGRIEPACPHFGLCGGCSAQHLDDRLQLEAKSTPLYQALRELAPETELLPPVPSQRRWYYRTKVEFSFLQQNREGLTLGFNRRGRFDQLIQLERCRIGPVSNRVLIARTRAWAEKHDLKGWRPREHTGDLRYLILRQSAATRQWLVALVTSPELERAPVEELAQQLRAEGCHGFVWVRQSSVSAAVVPDSEELIMGEPCIEERLGELRFSLNWRSFFQVNPPAYFQMLQQARQWVRAGSWLDLYCGIGTIGLSLAGPEQRLVGVESVPPAVEDARENARLNGFPKAEFHCLMSREWEDFDFEALVLDPPRSGCHPKVVERVAERGPEKLLYISCNPKRFLEEMQTLTRNYRLVRARAFDFFPNTYHLELLCQLERI